jgi:ribonuclease BN (tRNA processing enzyme)
MELTVLGAGPAYSDRAGSIGASYLVVHEGDALVLDLGQGAFPSLARAWEPSRLLGVVVSHLHPDHFVDLVPLRHYLRYEFTPPKRVSVFAPRGVDRRLDGLHDEPGWTAQALDIVELSEGVRTIGPFDLETVPVTHDSESYGFRVSVTRSTGPGLVYSGDCGRADDLRALVRPRDTLLVEVAFGPGPVPAGAQHLDGQMVGDLAHATGVGSLLLTHLQMGFDPDETIVSVRERFGEVGSSGPGTANGLIVASGRRAVAASAVLAGSSEVVVSIRRLSPSPGDGSPFGPLVGVARPGSTFPAIPARRSPSLEPLPSLPATPPAVGEHDRCAAGGLGLDR